MTAKASSKTAGRVRLTQAERREAAERRLLEAAVRLIAERGVSRTTLGDIGEAAGYSRTLTAAYFRDREGLVQFVWDYAAAAFRRKMEAAGSQAPGLNSVLGFVRVYLTPTGEDPLGFRAAQMLLTEAFTSSPEIREEVANYNRMSERFLRKHLRIGVEAGEVRPDIKPAAQGVVIMGALRGTISQWIIDSTIDLAGLREELCDLLRRGLAADHHGPTPAAE